MTSRWLAPLRASAESLLYSPVWLMPLLLVAESVAPTGGNWWLRKLHEIPTNPGIAYAAVALLVGFRPLVVNLPRFLLATVGIVRVRHSWAEELGRQLVAQIGRGLSAEAVAAELGRRAEQGNLDGDHLHGLLWLWVCARYRQDRLLERRCAVQASRFLDDPELRRQARVWCLRSGVLLKTDQWHLLPPMCLPELRQTQ